MKAREVALTGLMVAISLLLDVIPLDLPTVWGMKIDLVAVPMVVLYLITGLRGALSGLLVLFLALTLVSPASWLGAMMKVTATLAVVLGLEFARRTVGMDFGRRDRLLLFGVVAYIVGVVIRVPLMLLLNYYVALPVWLGLPREQVVGAVENWTGVPFWVAIGLPNAVQSAIDVFLGLAIAVPVLKRLPHFDGFLSPGRKSEP